MMASVLLEIPALPSPIGQQRRPDRRRCLPGMASLAGHLLLLALGIGLTALHQRLGAPSAQAAPLLVTLVEAPHPASAAAPAAVSEKPHPPPRPSPARPASQPQTPTPSPLAERPLQAVVLSSTAVSAADAAADAAMPVAADTAAPSAPAPAPGERVDLMAAYSAQVSARLYAARPRALPASGQTRVHLVIAADGSLLSAVIVKSSGSRVLDQAAMAAIHAAAPFPPPPEALSHGAALAFDQNFLFQ